MAKRKYPSELNTRTVRVDIGTWQLLKSLAYSRDCTMNEALHIALRGELEREAKVKPSRAQMPMIPTEPSVVVNGKKSVAFRIKPKGVNYE